MQISYFVSEIYSVVMIMESELKSVVSAAIRSLGYDVVKPEQEIALLSIRWQDVFVSLPTGYGKSLCYAALPAVFDSLTLSRATSQFCTTRYFIEWAGAQFCTSCNRDGCLAQTALAAVTEL